MVVMAVVLVVALVVVLVLVVVGGDRHIYRARRGHIQDTTVDTASRHTRYTVVTCQRHPRR